MADEFPSSNHAPDMDEIDPPTSPSNLMDAVVEKGPWFIVPTLYFTQAIPVTLVQELSPIVYKDFGIDNKSIAVYTSLVALPWTVKALWGPLIDLNGTKRHWIILFQGLLAAALIGWGVLTGVGSPLALSLAVLGTIALFSASCDIATDGFYLLAFSKERQAQLVGLQSLCYRLGRLALTGGLVSLQGYLVKERGVSMGLAWMLMLLTAGVVYLGIWGFHSRTLPRPRADQKRTQSGTAIWGDIYRTLSALGVAFSAYFLGNSIVRLTANLMWKQFDGAETGSLKGWKLTSDQVGQEYVQLIVCGVLVVFFVNVVRRLMTGTEMGSAFTSFIRQKGFAGLLLLLVFYRMGEAMVVKMAPLFMKDAVSAGGLGFNNEKLGLVSGTIGVVGIVFGGLVAGPIIARVGLRRAFLPLALAMHLPNFAYLALAYSQNTDSRVVGVVAFIEQFGYGIGYAAYSIYLQRIAQRGNYPTAHYAIGTAMGALCIMISGILSGIIQSSFGYPALFWAAIFAALPGLLAVLVTPKVE